MSNPRCDTCRFWEDLRDEKGVCRRYPPQLSDHSLRFYAENPDPDDPPPATEESAMVKAYFSPDVWLWPATAAGDWCGEWQPVPGPPGA